MNMGFAAEPVADEASMNFEGMDDFLAYLDGPHSVGLDNMRAELRHMILLMMELQGYQTGYRSQQMLGFGHTGMIMNGLLASDQKRKLEAEIWDELDKLLAQLDSQFTLIVSHAQKRIRTVHQAIVEQVEAIDAQISAQAVNETHKEALKAGNEQRTILKWLKRRLERHEEDLQQADTAAEAVQVHQKIEQDIEDFEQGNVSVNRAANRPNPFTNLVDFVRTQQAIIAEPYFNNTRDYQQKPDAGHGESDDSKDTAGSGGKSGKGGKSGAGGKTDGKASGSGAGEKDDLPPPPVAPL